MFLFSESAKPSDSAHLVDPNFVAEMRPRAVAEVSPDMKPTATAAGPSEYKPFLITIIVLLAAYLFANLYIMQGFRGETQAVGYSKWAIWKCAPLIIYVLQAERREFGRDDVSFDAGNQRIEAKGRNDAEQKLRLVFADFWSYRKPRFT